MVLMENSMDADILNVILHKTLSIHTFDLREHYEVLLTYCIPLFDIEFVSI